mmetsp:Transcript_177120/g.568029  ORF Transcript_177120/g.568029 Transcript_177120/m.568029 type:complete len:307 (+) Transcript_177120:2675-3595(+)
MAWSDVQTGNRPTPTAFRASCKLCATCRCCTCSSWASCSTCASCARLAPPPASCASCRKIAMRTMSSAPRWRIAASCRAQEAALEKSGTTGPTEASPASRASSKSCKIARSVLWKPSSCMLGPPANGRPASPFSDRHGLSWLAWRLNVAGPGGGGPKGLGPRVAACRTPWLRRSESRSRCADETPPPRLCRSGRFVGEPPSELWPSPAPWRAAASMRKVCRNATSTRPKLSDMPGDSSARCAGSVSPGRSSRRVAMPRGDSGDDADDDADCAPAGVQVKGRRPRSSGSATGAAAAEGAAATALLGT